MDVTHLTHIILEQIKTHPSYMLSTFFISGLVSGLPILGLLFPISIFLVGLSSAAAHIALNPLHILFALLPGLMMGDFTGFICGYYFNQTIKTWEPFKKHPYWFERAERIFQKYGGIAIIIGRISGPLRTVTPICAGILEITWTRFLAYDFLASLLWYITHVAPGYIAANPELWLYIKQHW